MLFTNKKNPIESCPVAHRQFFLYWIFHCIEKRQIFTFILMSAMLRLAAAAATTQKKRILFANKHYHFFCIIFTKYSVCFSSISRIISLLVQRSGHVDYEMNWKILIFNYAKHNFQWKIHVRQFRRTPKRPFNKFLMFSLFFFF